MQIQNVITPVLLLLHLQRLGLALEPDVVKAG